MNVTYRAAVPEDFDFLYSLHRAAMQVYVMKTWGEWDEDQQREHFRRHFDPTLLRVIQVEGQDVGVIQVQDRAEEVFLVNLEILPEFQNRGIGTQVIREVVSDAARRGKPVALQVLKVNFGARALYQRLGFGITGENDTHYIMANENWARVGQ